jgi:hypothetical protein
VYPAFGSAYLSTLKGTTSAAATLTFRVYGNKIDIFRKVGAGQDDMNVRVDGVLYGPIVNTLTTTPTPMILPHTIDNLVGGVHVVQISKAGPDGPELVLDAFQGTTTYQMVASAIYDAWTHPYIGARGSFFDKSGVTGAYALTTRELSVGAEASFTINGNNLCVQYGTPSLPVEVWIDGVQVDADWDTVGVNPIPEVTTSGSFLKWCLEADGHKLVADSVHYVRLKAVAGTTATKFVLDYVQSMRHLVLTSALLMVQETYPGIKYETLPQWTLYSNASLKLAYPGIADATSLFQDATSSAASSRRA